MTVKMNMNLEDSISQGIKIVWVLSVMGVNCSETFCKDYRGCVEIFKHHSYRGLRPLPLTFSSISESNTTDSRYQLRVKYFLR